MQSAAYLQFTFWDNWNHRGQYMVGTIPCIPSFHNFHSYCKIEHCPGESSRYLIIRSLCWYLRNWEERDDSVKTTSSCNKTLIIMKLIAPIPSKCSSSKNASHAVLFVNPKMQYSRPRFSTSDTRGASWWYAWDPWATAAGQQDQQHNAGQTFGDICCYSSFPPSSDDTAGAQWKRLRRQ